MTLYQLKDRKFRIVAIALVLFTLLSCKHTDKKGYGFSFQTDEKGNIETLTIDNKEQKSIYQFDTNGNCLKITKTKNGLLDGEQISFYNDVIVQKGRFKNGLLNGCLFDFYSGSGALKKYRWMVLGKENDLGLDYFDNTVPVVKSSLYFDNNGKIFYKQNFDSLSNLINDEGRKPNFVK